MKKILALWTHSRARSTAFGRMIYQRGDFCIKDEPFARYYYYSDERVSQRMGAVEAQTAYRFANILEHLVQTAENQPLFIKDHAFYVAARADPAFIAHFQNTFLVRHPAQSLPSLFDKMPDFTLQEAGYAELYQLFEFVKGTEGETPVVIDADDLVRSPEATIRAYCETVGIAFLPEALSWKPELPAELSANWWEGTNWHPHLEKSRGFKEGSNPNYVAVDENEHLKRSYEFCLPFYQKLYEYRLRIP